MYFGYAQIWRFTFIPIGFAIVMGSLVALCLVYAVGASRGKRAADRYLKRAVFLTTVALALDLGYAIVSGQLALFLTTLDWAPLVEMTALALMCLAPMWFMGSRYVAEKHDGELAAGSED